MNDCGHKSLGNEDKATQCMKGKEGYSDDCAGCFGATISCTAKKCWAKCIGGETAACTSCVDANCTPDLKACSGLTPPSAVSVADGSCTNSGDQSIWTAKGKDNFHSDMNDCGHKSLGNEDKATQCMKGKEGYSDDCAGCFGATISCTAKKCWAKCIGGETAACTSCVDANCTPDLKACSGLTPPSSIGVVMV